MRVPTTVLWGEGDTALLGSLLDGVDAWVPRLDVRRRPQATHWIVHEQPQEVAALVLELLRAVRGTA